MKKLEELRAEIAATDAEMINLIARRKEISKKIGDYKIQHHLPVLDSARETWLRDFHDALCKSKTLNPNMIHQIFEILIEDSKKSQHPQ